MSGTNENTPISGDFEDFTLGLDGKPQANPQEVSAQKEPTHTNPSNFSTYENKWRYDTTFHRDMPQASAPPQPQNPPQQDVNFTPPQTSPPRQSSPPPPNYNGSQGGYGPMGGSPPPPFMPQNPYPRNDANCGGSFFQGENSYYNQPPNAYRLPVASPQSKSVALILCLLGFFGIAGMHRIYVGKISSGLLLFFTAGFCFLGTLVDLILICTNQFTDANGYPLL